MEGKIYAAISAIMSECGAIGKEKKAITNKNTGAGYNYRGVDDVMNKLQPLLAKHKVFVIPEVIDYTREERKSTTGGTLIYTVLKVKYTFYCDDGSNVCATVNGEAMDSGDKSSNKAMSAAFKYACFQTFCIPTEEFHDSEEDTYEIQDKAQYYCAQCSKPITGTAKASAKQIADYNIKQFGRYLCAACGAVASKAAKAAKGDS